MICYVKNSHDKFSLTKTYEMETGILAMTTINAGLIRLEPSGKLTISATFAWDGASMFPDLQSIMRGSLVHDALTTLVNMGLLSYRPYRRLADELLYVCCLEDGMPHWLSNCVFTAVRGYSEMKYILK